MDVKKLTLPDTLDLFYERIYNISEDSTLIWNKGSAYLLTLPDAATSKLKDIEQPLFLPPDKVIKIDNEIYFIGKKRYSGNWWFYRYNLETERYEALPLTIAFDTTFELTRAGSSLVLHFSKGFYLFETESKNWISISPRTSEELYSTTYEVFGGQNLFYMPLRTKVHDGKFALLEPFTIYNFNLDSKNWDIFQTLPEFQLRTYYRRSEPNEPPVLWLGSSFIQTDLIWTGTEYIPYEDSSAGKEFYDGLVFHEDEGWKIFNISDENKKYFDIPGIKYGSTTLVNNYIYFNQVSKKDKNYVVPRFYNYKTGEILRFGSSYTWPGNFHGFSKVYDANILAIFHDESSGKNEGYLLSFDA